VERDRLIKRDLYARNGVREYWMADPQVEAIEVLWLVRGKYVPRGYFRRDETLGSPLLTGLRLPVREVFA
jgi:Uma2 family endonuclease